MLLYWNRDGSRAQGQAILLKLEHQLLFQRREVRLIRYQLEDDNLVTWILAYQPSSSQSSEPGANHCYSSWRLQLIQSWIELCFLLRDNSHFLGSVQRYKMRAAENHEEESGS